MWEPLRWPDYREAQKKEGWVKSVLWGMRKLAHAPVTKRFAFEVFQDVSTYGFMAWFILTVLLIVAVVTNQGVGLAGHVLVALCDLLPASVVLVALSMELPLAIEALRLKARYPDDQEPVDPRSTIVFVAQRFLWVVGCLWVVAVSILVVWWR